MMPFVTYKKTLFVNRDTYGLFNSINDLDLYDGLFKNNEFDLTVSIKNSMPLIMKFTRNNGGLRGGYLDPSLLAEFERTNLSGTRINIKLRNRGIMIPLVMMLVSIFAGIIKQNMTNVGFVTVVFIIAIIACIDIYKKSILLKRFEELINNL